MNENWLNGKYNLIYVGKEKETLVTGSVPKNVVLHTGKLSDIAFKIRQQELDNDEVFSGNLITTESVSNIDFDTIFKLSLDDNSLYVNYFLNSPHATECEVGDSLIYCSSIVLWMISQYDRNDYSLYANLRRNRVVLKRFGDYV
jgi:hypothetical protein|tara:strand:+ start:563 stop:994 length:432 start_codon:yes stop_codon:yes gene_type:complete